MEMTVLGRCGPFPQAGQACSSYLITDGSTRLLVDCGSGALSRLAGIDGALPLDAVLISHLHYDHCGDLPILRYRCEQLHKDALPMRVFAPREPSDVHQIMEHPAFLVTDAADGMTERFGSLTVTWRAVRHAVPAYGLDIRADGGKRLFYTGDTRWFDGLAELARGADAILADCCLLDKDDDGRLLQHLTARQGGRLARDAGAKRLFMTHVWGGGTTGAQMEKEVDNSNATVVQELGHYII